MDEDEDDDDDDEEEGVVGVVGVASVDPPPGFWTALGVKDEEKKVMSVRRSMGSLVPGGEERGEERV